MYIFTIYNMVKFIHELTYFFWPSMSSLRCLAMSLFHESFLPLPLGCHYTKIITLISEFDTIAQMIYHKYNTGIFIYNIINKNLYSSLFPSFLKTNCINISISRQQDINENHMVSSYH